MRSAVLVLCLALGASALAADRPGVLVISDLVKAETVRLVAVKFDGTILLDRASSPDLTLEALRDRVAQLASSSLPETNLLLLSARPDSATPEQQKEILRDIVRQVSAMHRSLLWINAPGPEMAEFNQRVDAVLNEADVSQLDYARFCTRPARSGWTTEQLLADLLQEALGQWWWVCAPDNDHLVRSRLWPGLPPQYQRLGADLVNYCGRVQRISQPEIVRYQSPVAPRGPALIYFPGGGYSYLGFYRNVDGLGAKLSPLGITVFALKYRTGRGGEIPLVDAARAVR